MIRIFEMFAGYGGASFALKKLGVQHEVVGWSKIDKYASQCFQQNHGGKNYGDCKLINPEELPDFDLLTGGFPCKSFSVAGKMSGETDARGTLFYEIIRIAEVKKPKYMLLENVKGLTCKKFKATFDKILSELDRIGYVVYWKVLNSKDFGIPQSRSRVWFVCIRKDIHEPFMFSFPVEEPLKIFIKDILEDNVAEKYYLSDVLQKRFEEYLKNKVDTKGCLGTVPMTCTKRSFETPKYINQFLKDSKGGKTIDEIATALNLPKTQVEHYFRIDDSRAVPSPEIWMKLKVLLNFNDTFDKEVTSVFEKQIEFEQTRRVYDSEGVSPTLNTIQEPLILQNHRANEIREYKEGISPMLTENHDHKSGTNAPIVLQKTQDGIREYNETMPTLRKEMGDNMPVVIDNSPIIVSKVGNGQTYKEHEGVSTTLRGMARTNNVPMVTDNPIKNYKEDGDISVTLSATSWKGYGNDGTNIYNSMGKLRRLTPTECFRLMGFLNDEINLEGISDSQRYKLAGNGWEIGVASKILKNILKEEADGK